VQNSSAAMLVVLLVAVSATAGARPPPEQQDNLIDDRFAMSAEFIDATTSTQLRLDSSAGTLGTVVNAESDLGLPARKVLGIGDVMFRISSRWRMQIEYWFVPLDRSGETTLTKTINFKDDTFQIGDQVNSQLDMHVLAINWAYSFLRTENYELSASLGVDAIEFSAAATVSSLLSTQREDKSGPAPLAGLEGTVRLSSRWYLGGRFEYLKAHLSDVKGDITTFEFTTLYRLNPNITFGAGYRSFHINLTSEQVGTSGMFDLKTSGPLLLVRVGF
jgi:hypothetical protein